MTDILIVIAAVGAAAFFAGRRMYRNYRNTAEGSGCGSCAGCSCAGSCTLPTFDPDASCSPGECDSRRR